MAGLGTYFALLMIVARFSCGAENFFTLAGHFGRAVEFPLPYIANTAGWMTAEIGRQPWIVYGLIRTSEGYSSTFRRATDYLPCWDSWECTACSRFCSLFEFIAPSTRGPELQVWRTHDAALTMM